MKIEINDDALDEIFRCILIQDYLNLKNDIKRLKDSPNLPEHKKQDLRDHKKYYKAIKILLEYYVGFDWKQKIKNDV